MPRLFFALQPTAAQAEALVAVVAPLVKELLELRQRFRDLGVDGIFTDFPERCSAPE